MSMIEASPDRTFVPRSMPVPLRLYVRQPADGAVLVTMTNELSGNVVFSRAATFAPTLDPDEEDPYYEITLSSAETAEVGYFALLWSYTFNGIAQTYDSPIEVGSVSAAYRSLSLGFQGVVESVWMRFSDLFDSPLGGPHLQVYFQTKFGRDRLAQLLNVALGRLNTIAQPHQTYTLGQNKPFPLEKWGALLEQALYVEAIKHLHRSYVEQPMPEGLTVARMDRRDYMNRWAEVLQMEKEDLESQLDNFKIAHMGLGRPRVMVTGGVYGNWTAQRVPHMNARPRYWRAMY